jgi:CysZ protein
MVIESARIAFAQALSPPFRAVLIKSLALTIGGLVLVWALMTRFLADWAHSLAAAHPIERAPWYVDVVTWTAGLVSGSLLLVGLMFLVGPITALVASFFLDDIAGQVEAADYPADPPGRPVPAWSAIFNAIGFFGAVIAVNLVCLALLVVPGINLAAFFIGNGYLLGREYFELAALRFRPMAQVRVLRRQHRGTLFLGGMIIAGLLAVPLVNLLTPLFATAFMVHLHKRLTSPALAGGDVSG